MPIHSLQNCQDIKFGVFL
uniref:Uncharacterized protein n=1 Tax=Arundo donax TaxID=35708 RepID=A0A0A8ZQ49_ARUDO